MIRKKRYFCTIWSAVLYNGSFTASGASIPNSLLADNLAPLAKVKADSEYSQDYLARFVTDGKIPVAQSQKNLRIAWCVSGNTHRQEATLSFQWPRRGFSQTVTVAEMIYFGRTAWHIEECWRDYEVYIDRDSQPILRVRLEAKHGDYQSSVLEAPSDGMQYFFAQPVCPRPRPPVLSPGQTAAMTTEQMAILYLQDVYLGLESTVRRGQIKRLRVVQELAKSVRIDPKLRACGKVIFADKSDPDYQAILVTFDLVLEMLSKTPRIDMPGDRPAVAVCRDCK